MDNEESDISKALSLTNLSLRAARVRHLPPYGHDERNLIRGVLEGSITLDPEEVSREIEAYIATVRCHDECKDEVRRTGHARFEHFPLDEGSCHVCSKPMNMTPRLVML